MMRWGGLCALEQTSFSMSIQNFAFHSHHKQHDRAPAQPKVSMLRFTVFSPVHQNSLRSLDMEQQNNTKGSSLHHTLILLSSAAAQPAAFQCQEMQYLLSINHS